MDIAGDVTPTTDDVTPTDVLPTEVLPPAAESVAHEPPAPLARPRVRWAGILWGLAFALIATYGLWVTAAPGAVDDLTARAVHLSPTTIAAGTLIALGTLALIAGLVGLLRHAQRARERRQA